MSSMASGLISRGANKGRTMNASLSSSSSTDNPTTHRSRRHFPSKTNTRKKTLKRTLFLICCLVLVAQLIIIKASLKYHADDTPTQTVSGSSLRGQPVIRSEQLQLLPPILHPPKGPPDGDFHGHPVYFRDVSDHEKFAKPYTCMHCLGENFQPDDTSWMHRSCHFKFFCFNVTNRKFQVYSRPDDYYLQTWSQKVDLMDLSESLLTNETFVSLGGVNLKWGTDGIHRLKWFPKILKEPPTEFYALPPDVVMVPFHSLGGWNPGHAVWDDFLPIFTLLEIFQMPKQEILALRYMLDDNQEPLWASCEASSKIADCHTMQRKFWPLIHNYTRSFRPQTQQSVVLNVASPKSDVVCAKNGLAGIGDLNDHGTKKLHGWHAEDYLITHNHGRGGLFWKFRNFCLQNVGIIEDIGTMSRPFQIVISVQSSTNSARNLDFSQLRQRLSDEWIGQDVVIHQVVLKDLSLKDQLQLAVETDIFITGCGGGAVTAMFLAKGSTVILYFNEKGGRRENVDTGLPARLDWDLFNHLSYIYVHWFPSGSMNERADLDLLSSMVRDAVRRRQQQLLDE